MAIDVDQVGQRIQVGGRRRSVMTPNSPRFFSWPEPYEVTADESARAHSPNGIITVTSISACATFSH